MEVWNEALKFELSKVSNRSYRELFIGELVDKMKTLGHAVLKKRQSVNELIIGNSDIDILIKKQDAAFYTSLIQSNPLIRKVKVHKKSFMHTVMIHFEDDSFLSLDLLFSFKRKSIEYLNAEEVLQHTIKASDQLKVPIPIHDFEYTYLFYLLNQQEMDLRHQQFFFEMDKTEQKRLLEYMNMKYDIKALSISDLFQNFSRYYNSILKKIKMHQKNSLLKRIGNILNYSVDLIKQLINNHSLTISFSGVDGAGKSTIIEEIKNHLQKKYRKRVIVLRHRPQVLPILSSYKYGREEAERKAANTLPRMGKNDSSLSSLLRFLYYYIDYLFGQIYIFIRYTMRDYIILYDRFYFDFINDNKRSNIVLNTNFVKSLYHFLLKPELNIYLYADAETILKRKQELDEFAINEMNEKYIQLFSDYTKKSRPERYLSIKNLNKTETINTIVNEYLKLV